MVALAHVASRGEKLAASPLNGVIEQCIHVSDVEDDPAPPTRLDSLGDELR